MRREQLRRRFWVETVLAGTAGFLAVMTLLWKDWVEILFRVDPDRHSGSLEWLVVATCLAVAVGLAAMARTELRRASTQPA